MPKEILFSEGLGGTTSKDSSRRPKAFAAIQAGASVGTKKPDRYVLSIQRMNARDGLLATFPQQLAAASRRSGYRLFSC
jgi:hypothetical protein